ncbi:hypothetical protein R50073_42520 [Maricurvus nonylphenolicus]|uniref:carboxymuconolactone decarboxylase family protein n=1 Tax=Maricurvus nonylphenolicus TaxID=1008307 RepID=UPI0036F3BB2A
MSFQYPNFGSNSLPTIFEAFPKRASLMMALMVDVMSDTEELSKLDKELIFTFTSYQNACHFCFESHKAVAQAYGMDQEQFAQIVEDIEAADIEPRLKTVFAFVQKLSNSPSKIVESDVEGLSSAGYSEAAVVDIISVCSLANYMNRFVDGLGVDITSEQAQQMGAAMLQGDGYDMMRQHVEGLASEA